MISLHSLRDFCLFLLHLASVFPERWSPVKILCVHEGICCLLLIFQISEASVDATFGVRKISAWWWIVWWKLHFTFSWTFCVFNADQCNMCPPQHPKPSPLCRSPQIDLSMLLVTACYGYGCHWPGMRISHWTTNNTEEHSQSMRSPRCLH